MNNKATPTMVAKIKRLYKINKHMAVLRKQQKELQDAIRSAVKVTARNPQQELLTPEYRALLSFVKEHKVPEYTCPAFVRITISENPEAVVKRLSHQHAPAHEEELAAA